MHVVFRNAGLRGESESHASAWAFGTRACADGRRAAPPRSEEASRRGLCPPGWLVLHVAAAARPLLRLRCYRRTPTLTPRLPLAGRRLRGRSRAPLLAHRSALGPATPTRIARMLRQHLSA